jgi:hypothetical protein
VLTEAGQNWTCRRVCGSSRIERIQALITGNTASVMKDEQGRPFIVVREYANILGLGGLKNRKG